MNVRAHMSMLFHLDKCIGCHTCSVACKNLWTDRKGAEYMWWNNVETRPGSGYPTQWEDQKHFKGGWGFTKADSYGEKDKLTLRLHTRAGGLAKLYYNPDCPAWKITMSHSPSATQICSTPLKATTSRPPSRFRW